MENQMMSDRIVMQREGGRSYLLIPEEMVCGDSEEWDQYMALGIRGLLSCKHCYRNGESYWSYDITGKQSLDDYYKEREIDFADCRCLLLSLDRILRRMYECLLSEEELRLEAEMMYIGMDEKELQLVYGRCGTGNFTMQIKQFAEYVIEHIDYQDERAVALAHQFYKYASADSFNMGEFLSENHAHLNPEEMEPACDEETETVGRTCMEEESYYELWIDQLRSVIKEDKETSKNQYPHKWSKMISPVCVILPLVLLTIMGVCMEYMRVQMVAVGMAYVAGVVVFYLHRYARAALVRKEEVYYMENSGRANQNL